MANHIQKFKDFVTSVDHERGPSLHSSDLHADISELPGSAHESAVAFKKKFLDAPDGPHIKQQLEGTPIFGITPKMFVSIPQDATESEAGQAKPMRNYMIKPYYEHPMGWSGLFYPISGFSEMATQGLLHASGLGHMAQKVHTFHFPINQKEPGMDTEHADYLNDEEKKYPLLAIEFSPGFKRIEYMSGLPDSVEENTLDDLSKLSVIDYITNHQDRHGGNLLMNEWGEPLAIDNGRSFNYRMGQRHAAENSYEEHPFHYFTKSPAMALFTSREHGQTPLLDGSRMSRVFTWWHLNRANLIKELDKHLGQFHDEDAKKWIRDNFMERVGVMDKWARLWENESAHQRDYFPKAYRQDHPMLPLPGLDIIPSKNLQHHLTTKIHWNPHGNNWTGDHEIEPAETSEQDWRRQSLLSPESTLRE